jgi:hypothetical protein
MRTRLFAVLLGCALGGFSSVSAQVVYYSMVNPIGGGDGTYLPLGEGSGLGEVGDEIILAPSTPRVLSSFSFEYFGEGFSGDETVQIRFYRNDGPLDPDGTSHLPQSLLFDSGPFSVAGGNHQLVTLGNLESQGIELPDSFTWSILFSGVGATEPAGVLLYNPPGTPSGSQVLYDLPAVGGNYYEFWVNEGTPESPAWSLQYLESFPTEFGAEITVVPEPWATTSVLLLTAAGTVVFLRRRRTAVS